LSPALRPSRYADSANLRGIWWAAQLISGITLALRATVPETSFPLEYLEPIVLWRMRRADGLHAHAVIGPRSNRAFVVWFVNGAPLGFRDFADWTSALRWSDQLHAQNWAVGWRPTPE